MARRAGRFQGRRGSPAPLTSHGAIHRPVVPLSLIPRQAIGIPDALPGARRVVKQVFVTPTRSRTMDRTRKHEAGPGLELNTRRPSPPRKPAASAIAHLFREIVGVEIGGRRVWVVPTATRHAPKESIRWLRTRVAVRLPRDPRNDGSKNRQARTISSPSHDPATGGQDGRPKDGNPQDHLVPHA